MTARIWIMDDTGTRGYICIFNDNNAYYAGFLTPDGKIADERVYDFIPYRRMKQILHDKFIIVREKIKDKYNDNHARPNYCREFVIKHKKNNGLQYHSRLTD